MRTPYIENYLKIRELKNFIFNLNPLDCINCPDKEAEFMKYNSGFQDFKSAISVYLDRNFPDPIIHDSNGTEQ